MDDRIGNESTIASEFENGSLAAVLQRVCKSAGLRDVEIACAYRGTFFHATIANGSPSSADSSGYRARAGCLAKFLSATLAAHAVADGKFRLDDRILDLIGPLDLSAERRDRLADLTLVNLLNHSHGLDDSLVRAVPRATSGRLALPELLAALTQTRPLARAGKYYNYGGAGVWLLASLIERAYASSYPVLLQDLVLGPLGIEAFCGERSLNELAAELRAGTDTSDGICPAVGHELRLSARELLKLCRHHLSADQATSPADEQIAASLTALRERSFQPPGWQPKMRAVGLGVHDYGNGWYGHNSRYQQDSAVVRFHPRSGAAVAITAAQEHAAHAVLGAIFGRSMPEFSVNQTLKLLSPEQWAAASTAQYVGRYENGAFEIDVDISATKAPRVRVYLKSDLAAGNSEPFIKRYLRPAVDDVFFSNPAEPMVVPFVQFLERDERGYGYLQNGGQLFVKRA